MVGFSAYAGSLEPNRVEPDTWIICRRLYCTRLVTRWSSSLKSVSKAERSNCSTAADFYAEVRTYNMSGSHDAPKAHPMLVLVSWLLW